MAYYSSLLLHIVLLLVPLYSCLASQYVQKPGTSIIETVDTDNTITSYENGGDDLGDNSSDTCPESEKILENPSLENQHTPDFSPLNYLPPNQDPYLRTTFYNGHYYPYSAYNAYRNMYQDPLNDSGRRKDSRYNDIWYPYINPSAYSTVPYSTIPPVKSLPPVFASLYGSSWPIDQESFPSQIRRQRKPRDEDDFLEQLEYDSIMKNILPTMPIPLARGALPQSAISEYSYATFPHGISDCGLPILLGCTPKITYGNIQNIVPTPYAHAYRNLQETNKAHDHVDINDDKESEKH